MVLENFDFIAFSISATGGPVQPGQMGRYLVPAWPAHDKAGQYVMGRGGGGGGGGGGACRSSPPPPLKSPDSRYNVTPRTNDQPEDAPTWFIEDDLLQEAGIVGGRESIR